MGRAEIGVFGGSGFYSLLDEGEEIKIDTPYGAPSDKYFLGEMGGKKVAFLPRHGREHQYPPHSINYRANVWGMKSLGVSKIIGPGASGSLNKEIGLGDFVVCDQYIDRTKVRRDTFYDGPVATHVSSADPFCPTLRRAVTEKARELGITVHEKGTVVVVQGPRFSTRAESRWFTANGWDAINMTAYPEAHLARELELCYVNICLVTDYDVGLSDDPDVPPVTAAEVGRVFGENNDRLKDLLFAVIPALDHPRDCICTSALENACL